ncbi:hypothetical protein OAR18_03775 [Candidatus Pseudothioglobus singularis]|nr:hypothetical protein [Candidatus Pseudothioglobus singularis]
MKKILPYFFCLFLVHSPGLLAFEPLYEPDVPDTFNIQIDKGRVNKYLEQFYGAARKNIIPEKSKKWHKASIRIGDGLNEKMFKSKIRITGDDPAHVDVINHKASLKVKLLNGNIGNITKFRLLLEEAQGDGRCKLNCGAEDEIFWALLMEKIGFPTPYKKIVTVNFLGQEYQAVFEESIEKEFIERWGFRESPIISYDERQLMENIQNGVLRPEFFGPSILNQAFLKNNTATKIAYEGMFVNKYFRLKEFYEINGQYAKHGITINNRRFLFDPIYSYKIPVYFDGNPRINLEDSPYARSKNIDCNIVGDLWTSSGEEIQKIFKHFKFNFSKRSKKIINPIQECIAMNILMEVSEWDEDQIQNVDLRVGNKGDYFDFERNFSGGGKILDIWNLENYIGSTPELFRYNDNGVFETCRIVDTKNKLLDCTAKSFEESVNYLSGDSEPYSFNGSKVFPLVVDSPKEDRIQTNELLFLDDSEPKKITVSVNTTLRIAITEKAQEISLFLDNPQTSRVVFYGSTGEGLKINVIAPKKSSTDDSTLKGDSLIRYDDSLLTSCVTFIDTTFSGGEISMTGGACEDSVNFIRSKGVINLISIEDAAFDALDIDFSSLTIKEVMIINAGNDCIDMSSGEYNFNKINASYCGDKIISVGEKSRVTINKAILGYGDTGIAVKDSSIAYLDNAKITSTKNCLTVYRKKQEFNGGSLHGRDVVCDDLSETFVDIESNISLNEIETCLYLGSFDSIDYCIFKNFVLFESKDCEILNGANATLSIFMKDIITEGGLNKKDIIIKSPGITEKQQSCSLKVNLPTTHDKIVKIIITDGNKKKESSSTHISIKSEYYL